MERVIDGDNLVPALQKLAARRGFSKAWGGGDPALWRDELRPLLRDLILPGLPDLPFAPVWTGEEDRGDHLARSFRIAFAEGVETAGLLLMPKGQGPFPAILALHDHGSNFQIGAAKCILPLGDTPPEVNAWLARFYGGQSPGLALVRQGFAVMALDALGWGSRAGNGYEAQQALACNLMNTGFSHAGLVAWEDLRAAAFLRALPGIDPGRIGAFGLSFGGFRAWQLAALSDDVAVAAASGWMSSLPGLMVAGNNHIRGQSAFTMTHPGLAAVVDLPDFAALAAPKPLWLSVGRADALFPDAAVTPAFDRLAAHWHAHNAPDKICCLRPAGGHEAGLAQQQLIAEWFLRWL